MPFTTRCFQRTPNSSYNPYTTLANLLAALGDYETAVINYSHAIKLMLENGYPEDSDAVQEFATRILEVRQMQEDANVVSTRIYEVKT